MAVRPVNFTRWVLQILVVLMLSAGGCDSNTLEKRSPAPELVAVTAGMDTELFTAASPQQVRFKPGVDVVPIRDEDGNTVALRMNDGGNGIQMSCDCPGGCSPTRNLSCIVGHSGPNDGFCTGDCGTDNSSCFGCSFWLPASAAPVLAPDP